MKINCPTEISFPARKAFLVMLLLYSAFTGAQDFPAYILQKVEDFDEISNREISAIVQDDDGFLWMGTWFGLLRYDGYEVSSFKPDVYNPGALSARKIHALVLSGDTLWIGSSDHGLCYYDRIRETFGSFPESGSGGLGGKQINALAADRFGNIWTGTRKGFYRVRGGNPEKNIPLEFMLNDTVDEAFVSALRCEEGMGLWIGTSIGLYFLPESGYDSRDGSKVIPVSVNNPASANPLASISSLVSVWDDDSLHLWTISGQGLSHFRVHRAFLADAMGTGIKTDYISSGEIDRVLGELTVRSMFYDTEKEDLWIGTDEKMYRCKPDGSGLLDDLEGVPNRDLRISSIYKDLHGTLWVGTITGLYRVGSNIRFFRTLGTENPEPGTRLITTLIEMDSSYLACTIGDGLFLTRMKQDGTFGEMHPLDMGSAYRNNYTREVNCGLRDKNGFIWLGTRGRGLVRFRYDGERISDWAHYGASEMQTDIRSESIISMAEHPEGSILAGTFYSGILKIDPSGSIQMISNFAFSEENQTDYPITDILVESEEVIWAGTRGDGFFRITLADDGSFDYTAFRNTKNELGNLVDNFINNICMDHYGDLWLGTDGGLSLFNRRTMQFRNFYESDGLSDNCIQGLMEDAGGMLWASTINGLNKIDPRILLDSLSDNAVQVFEKEDGLPDNYFFEGSAQRLRNDWLLMGTLKGAVYFNPSASSYKASISNPVIKAIFLEGKQVKPGEEVNGRILFRESLSRLKKLELKASEKNLSIAFSAPTFDFPDRTSYAYRLRGYDDQWIPTDAKNLQVTYLNFPSGDYTFEVRASNPDGSWNPNLATLQISHALPLWKSPLAWVVYVLFLAGLLLLFRKMIMQRSEWMNQISLESYKREQNEELHQHKLRFFTNISHEIKTPLSLIIGPVKQAMKSKEDSDRDYALELVHRNANRLINLVNQLLEFRKAETENLSLGVSSGDIAASTRGIVEDFRYYAGEKKIRLDLELEDLYMEVCIDRDKYEKILYNLLSNAVKYTSPGGSIRVRLFTEEGNTKKTRKLVCRVEDSGSGIPAEKMEHIFERYYRAGQNETGIGIGLALTKKIVEVHRGEIAVESEEGKGSVFQFKLPLDPEFYAPDEFAGNSRGQAASRPFLPENGEGEQEEMQEIPFSTERILIVEDDPELRKFLKHTFHNSYRVYTAGDGAVGYQLAIREKPDLVIADYMMPGLNGIELFNKLKKYHDTEDVSFILLTAHLDEKVEKEISEAGADLVINKPFDPELLVIKVKNILGRHKKIRTHLQKELQIQQLGQSTEEVQKPGEQDRIIDFIDKHCTEEHFSIDYLAQELSMSRMKLYRTIKAHFKMSPVELIRKIRMVKVAASLKEKNTRVSDVAFAYGFNDMKYFRDCFKKEFGMTPTEYVKMNR